MKKTRNRPGYSLEVGSMARNYRDSRAEKEEITEIKREIKMESAHRPGRRRILHPAEALSCL